MDERKGGRWGDFCPTLLLRSTHSFHDLGFTVCADAVSACRCWPWPWRWKICRRADHHRRLPLPQVLLLWTCFSSWAWVRLRLCLRLPLLDHLVQKFCPRASIPTYPWRKLYHDHFFVHR